jgi:hypothetical protein
MAFAGNPKFDGYWIRSRDITYADTGTTVGAITIPANTFVQRVIGKVTAAFSTGGYVDVGDGDDPDGWIPAIQALVSDGTLAVRGGSSGAVYVANGGKGFLTADTIDVQLVDSTAGSYFVAAYMVPLGDMD